MGAGFGVQGGGLRVAGVGFGVGGFARDMSTHEPSLRGFGLYDFSFKFCLLSLR